MLTWHRHKYKHTTHYVKIYYKHCTHIKLHKNHKTKNTLFTATLKAPESKSKTLQCETQKAE